MCDFYRMMEEVVTVIVWCVRVSFGRTVELASSVTVCVLETDSCYSCFEIPKCDQKAYKLLDSVYKVLFP